MEKFSRSFADCNGNRRSVVWWRIPGMRPGPVLTIVAGQHGMEHVGPGLLPEFAEEMERQPFAGELRLVCNANPFALLMDYEFYPEHEDLSRINDYYYSIFRHNYCPWGLGRDEAHSLYNMNRLWNRSEIIGVAGEITDWLWKEVILPADLVLDLHGHQHPPLIYSGAGTDFQLASFPGIRALVMSRPVPDDWNVGTLNYQAKRVGIKAVCLEFSVQHARGEFEFEAGKQFLRNIMIGCRMLPGEIRHDHPVWRIPYNPEEDQRGVLSAEKNGRLRFFKQNWDEVRQGELIFTIRDVETGEVVQEGRAGRDGVVGFQTHKVIVREGDFCTYVPIPELLVPAGRVVEKYTAGWWKK